ncbi:CLUMA_CG018293, isoform A [Clunio marinus]|uniref:CLUMA_CG018293, isoform A n=1 Tax=Clunio marinus TaxID=568069 RepID=A0A1J1J134_9DIPT|nr:CLUMA_CG018293, isoform A [Clunio marinus]
MNLKKGQLDKWFWIGGLFLLVWIELLRHELIGKRITTAVVKFIVGLQHYKEGNWKYIQNSKWSCRTLGRFQ